jgi:putative Ig domain-containing protein
MSKNLAQTIHISIGIVSLAFLGLTGCSLDSSQTDATGSGTAGPNHPPAIRSITLTPIPIVRNGVVTATVEAEDLDRDVVTFTFKWIVNDEPRPEEVSSTFHPERLNLGDRVTVEAIPHDGKIAGLPVRSQSVVVGNTPPDIRALTIQPSNAKVGDGLIATVDGSDIDGEDIRYTYRWSHNNRLIVEGEQGTLDTTGFSRGDVIAVSVTPHDRGSHGKEKLSDLLTLANSPPKFTSSVPGIPANRQFGYVASAVDPENDPLTFALESAPSGMTIDEKTGRIQWDTSPASAGVYKVKVSVKDDHQGWASQEFDVTLGNSVTAKREGP